MNKQIKELAEQAGLDMTYPHCIEGTIDDLERFAELIRADERNKCAQDYLQDCSDAIDAARLDETKACAKHYLAVMRDAVEQAVLKEREICAKMCEFVSDNFLRDNELERNDGALYCADAIRAKGNT